MDKFSFLNAASASYFEDLYNQYLQYPDSVEPSWRAFFQGFDFGIENTPNGEVVVEVAPKEEEAAPEPGNGEIPDAILYEFRVVQLIEAYRTRGHLFTKTNPVRERRKHTP